jgi:hypothetical protein
VSREEARHALSPAFRIERAFAPIRSVPRRQGQEQMVFARRTNGPA